MNAAMQPFDKKQKDKGECWMPSEFKKFKEMMLDEEERKRVLQQEIEEACEELVRLGNQYEKAIINDDDAQADTLQQQISTNQRALKRKEDKLALMNKNVPTEEFKNQADKVLQEVNESINDLNTKAITLAEEYHELRCKLIEKAREIGENQRSDRKHIDIANYVARNLPEWAKTKGMFRHNSPVDRYEYERYVSTPDLKAFDYAELQKVKGGMGI